MVRKISRTRKCKGIRKIRRLLLQWLWRKKRYYKSNGLTLKIKKKEIKI